MAVKLGIVTLIKWTIRECCIKFSLINLKEVDQEVGCEISSSHGGEYDVQSCLLGCTAM
jgi:hypothetical protein